jgi:hypothetical protein
LQNRADAPWAERTICPETSYFNQVSTGPQGLPCGLSFKTLTLFSIFPFLQTQTRNRGCTKNKTLRQTHDMVDPHMGKVTKNGNLKRTSMFIYIHAFIYNFIHTHSFKENVCMSLFLVCFSSIHK